MQSNATNAVPGVSTLRAETRFESCALIVIAGTISPELKGLPRLLRYPGAQA